MSIRNLFPNFTEEQLKIAEEKLLAYLASTLRTYDRISQDPKTYDRFKSLTAKMKHSTILKRSKKESSSK